MSDLSNLLQQFWPYLLVIVVGFLPTETWRFLAVFSARGLDERSEILTWVRYFSTALLAGVVSKLLFAPVGALASIPIPALWGSLLIGVSGFFLLRRSVLAGVALGEFSLIASAALLAA
jgi:hypothetical protein